MTKLIDQAKCLRKAVSIYSQTNQALSFEFLQVLGLHYSFSVPASVIRKRGLRGP